MLLETVDVCRRQLIDIRSCCAAEFSRNLESDVVSETSGHFQRLLVSALNANRDESGAVDSAKADHDARAIFEVCS